MFILNRATTILSSTWRS